MLIVRGVNVFPSQVEGGSDRRGIKDLVGVTVKLRLVEPGGVDRWAGKAKRVVDLRH
jgi:phenylacetate-coenzyme A ligase PaaK-like adenylate-forming protein